MRPPVSYRASVLLHNSFSYRAAFAPIHINNLPASVQRGLACYIGRCVTLPNMQGFNVFMVLQMQGCLVVDITCLPEARRAWL